MTDRVLIVDFGSQVTQLIARRVRESGVYCEIHPCTKVDAGFLARFEPRAVILSGGRASVSEAHTPRADPARPGYRCWASATGNRRWSSSWAAGSSPAPRASSAAPWVATKLARTIAGGGHRFLLLSRVFLPRAPIVVDGRAVAYCRRSFRPKGERHGSRCYERSFSSMRSSFSSCRPMRASM